MARGGRRSGTQGARYSNRSDLQQGPRAPVAIPGQDRYGAQAAQLRAQQAVPTGPTPVPAGPTPPPSVSATGPMPAGVPRPAGQTPVIPLSAPTMRPNEPLTAGVDIGPGPGAPPMSQPAEDPLIEELRAIYLAYPNEDLRELLEDVDTDRTF